MIENIAPFLQRLENEPELVNRLRELEADYPGSNEIRESFLEGTLLVLAEEEGMGFSIEDLRKYETRIKVRGVKDEEISPDDPELPVYLLLDHGWEVDEDVYKKAEKKQG